MLAECILNILMYTQHSNIAFMICLYKVRDLLKQRSTLKSEPDAVAVLDGTQEGAFQWVCFRELLVFKWVLFSACSF